MSTVNRAPRILMQSWGVFAKPLWSPRLKRWQRCGMLSQQSGMKFIAWKKRKFLPYLTLGRANMLTNARSVWNESNLKKFKGITLSKFSIWEIYEKNIENQCISLMTLLVIFKKCDFFPKNTWIFLERFAIDNRHLVEKLLKKTDFFVYFLPWWNEKVNNLVTNLF